MLVLLVMLAGPAHADVHVAESAVVGVNVTVQLGEAAAGQRLGFGVDAGFQQQRFEIMLMTVEGETAGGDDSDVVAWAEERPDLNWGPVAHVWWVGGTWSASLGARFGFTRPLRMGLSGGWHPGPGLALEVAPALSTAGWIGVDLEAALDLPWVQGRVGSVWTGGDYEAPRLHLGVFTVLSEPELWPGGSVWDPSELE